MVRTNSEISQSIYECGPLLYHHGVSPGVASVREWVIDGKISIFRDNKSEF